MTTLRLVSRQMTELVSFADDYLYFRQHALSNFIMQLLFEIRNGPFPYTLFGFLSHPYQYSHKLTRKCYEFCETITRPNNA